MNKKKQTIIYVNFSPYINAGNILDFLLSEYTTVICFTFRFHSLGKFQEKPNISIYQNHKRIFYLPIFQLSIPPSLVFVLLPLRSILFFLQIFFHLLRLRSRFGPFDIFFTVNAFTAWTGNVLQNVGIVKKTVYWVWDYYPLVHENPVIALMRQIYWYFDYRAVRNANKVVFLNPRIAEIHKERKSLNAAYSCVAIGTNPHSKKKSTLRGTLQIVFFGVIKKSEGLDIVFDALEQSTISFDAHLHVIGSGPDLHHFKSRAKIISQKITFYGYLPDDTAVDQIISKSHLGIATYLPEPGNVTAYTDPSKIKRYFSYNLPVITTDITLLSSEIKKYNAGEVISPTAHHLILAIEKIKMKYSAYVEGTKKLSSMYDYQKLYPQLFTSIT